MLHINYTGKLRLTPQTEYASEDTNTKALGKRDFPNESTCYLTSKAYKLPPKTVDLSSASKREKMKMKKLENSNDDDEERREKNSNQAKSVKLDFSNDYKHFTPPPSVGIILEDKYCNCGRTRASYEGKLSSFDVKSNDFYGVDKLTSEVFELDKSTIYFTKKSLMLNQFLEYTDNSTPTYVNDANGNRFSINVPTNKGQFKSATFNVVKVQENKNSHALCLPSLVFSDKKLVSLFRSVALYWFFCLNTVLSKSDVCRKKAGVTVFDLQTHDSVATFASNFELKFSPHIFNLDKFEDVNDDFFWKIVANSMKNIKGCGENLSLLVYDEHSIEKLHNDLFKKVLFTLIDTSGILKTNKTTSKNMKVKPTASCVEHQRQHRKSSATVEHRMRATTKKSVPGKHLCRKYTFDILDYGYVGTLFNRVVWKNRAIKNKVKSKKRTECCSRNERVQEIVVQCSMNDEAIDEKQEDEYNVMVDETCYVSEDYFVEFGRVSEDYFVDFDSYLQDLKRDEETSESVGVTIVKEEIGAADIGVSTASLEIQDSYFLPGDMLNIEEKDYPQYDLWCSPLIGEELLPPKLVKTVPNAASSKPPVEAFKPYRLWESSFTAEEDHIPNFDTGEFFSVFSIPYYPCRNDVQTREEPSVYNLWGSPNIIDFLPGIGCVRLVEDEYSSGGSSVSSSSESLEFDCRNDTFEFFKSRRQENQFVRGKFLNFKPVINGFVSFTDRGAFEYYKKPKLKEDVAQKMVRIPADYSAPILVDSKSFFVVDAADMEVKTINVETPPTSEGDTTFYFKPIQPAVKVETDMPPLLKRSESGTLYNNDQKLMVFKHELDSERNSDIVFQPKFVVSKNDAACQTDRIGCISRMNYSIKCDENVSHCYGLGNEKRTSQEQYVHSSAFFYSLEEVFNFLGKPGLGNIDVKAHVDFSCMF